MDFNLKQWSEQEHEHEHESESDEQQQQQQNKCAKIPKQMFLETPNQQLEVAALPLFVSSNNNQPNKITATPPAVPTSTSKFPWVGERYSFSITQWQELELQALIYRHMVAGASIPPELLQLVKRSLFTCSTPPPFYLHQYSPHFQPPVAAALLQAGYWGKGAMDPEPGRCRRTDGKKWRCSRDVVAGHKYCERHMHRGRNRSRKPVEFPAAASTSTADTLYKSSPTTGFASGSVCADTQFSLSRSGNSSPLDAFQLNPRCRTSDKNTLLGTQLESSSTTIYGDNSKNNNRVLMHFFDDYPRSGDTDGSMASSTTTSLSMSTPGNSSSDFLRLSTGTGNEAGPRGGRNGNGNDDGERDQHISWSAGGWGANPVGSMGGPLAEALRSSSNSSPTSVLHQLPRCSAPDTSFISV